jgi:hypothetical protein
VALRVAVSRWPHALATGARAPALYLQVEREQAYRLVSMQLTRKAPSR